MFVVNVSALCGRDVTLLLLPDQVCLGAVEMQPGQGRARRVERVEAGGVEFFAQLVDGGGPQTVALKDVLSFDGVRDTVEAVAAQLGEVWQKVQPAEASVEFGLALTAKAGKLTGLLVDSEGEASLKVILTWKQPQPT